MISAQRKPQLHGQEQYCTIAARRFAGHNRVE
jgi:hypothetical protein